MSERAPAEPKPPDAEKVSETVSKIAEQSQRLLQEFVERQEADGDGGEFQVLDPADMVRSFQELTQKMMADPAKVVETQLKLWQDYSKLWQSNLERMMGKDSAPVIEPAAGDRRFKDEQWSENPVFDYIKQSYLLASKYLHESVRETEGLDPHMAEKVDFYTRQYIDAVAPTNFAMSNPEVLRRTVETGGENLLTGLSNLLDDLERGKGKLRVKMTDLDRFKLGENVAVTPGKVIFQNDLMQLLQYTPSTDTVFKRPLLIIPPWINKYYILDLRPKNSFIKWAVEQGHTVFVISWVNPDEKLAHKDFENYMFEGPMAALDAIEQATGERECKVIGYCLGGTLLASMLAYMAEKGDTRVKAATFFVTMTDFSEPGELGVFIDEEQLAKMDEQMEKTGYFDGSSMAEAFNLLRANDLIWGFVINNYLMGKDPFPFDLLYWNSDSTRMPSKMHSSYLHDLYEKNLLCKKNGITFDGVGIDLSKVKTPAYFISAKEDHIAPWKSTYAGTKLLSGPVRFVLGMSGHIAGIVNPPASKKYGYWTNDALPGDADQWLAGAQSHDGSWWLDWKKWVQRYNGKKVAARVPGDGKLAVIEDAPGSYVRVRAD
ncbi:MAG: class I poly(R)-hydroxyalkanoic acid synthase [Gammaproteobacteria bacterium]|nr:class I poly(R)-hydroxyalkanoic acid synthase [Gammaproteobacteria bacterium]MDX2458661.1 class I poly(R)-hydroxyalkanoic acid synthase [Gammaproteobacteria bacterium]